MNLYGEQLNDLLYVGFNQDGGCFSCGIIPYFIYNNNNNNNNTIIISILQPIKCNTIIVYI